MQDADKACLNSVQKNLPDTKSLMCFFHVMQNVRKHKHLIKDNEHYELVKTDIRKLNKCVIKKMKISKFLRKFQGKFDFL